MVLATDGLSKRFGKRPAVVDLSLAVERGDVYGFLGPNGAGKTTTLRMLVGLIRPSAGTATLLGQRLGLLRRQALRRVGALIETPAFYSYLSGRDNLRMLADLTARCPAARVDAVIDRVGLAGRARDPVRTYSLGMKQRLGIAAALLPGPELVLLDEPTNGLDPIGIRDVRALIRSLASDDGLTVFLSSHLLVEVQQLCNRGAIINHGRTVWQGAIEDLLAARRRLRVRATPIERAAAVLAEAAPGAIIERAGEGGELLHVRGGEAAPEDLVERLVAAGCRVREIGAEIPTLEEVFVELVGTDHAS